MPSLAPTSFLEAFAVDRALARLLGRAMRDAPLDPAEYGVYSVIAEADEATVTSIADRLSVPLTTASDWVHVAIERGHVARERSEADRRRFRLSLTRDGAAAFRGASERFGSAFQAFRAHAAIDEQALLRTLGAMRAAIDAAAEDLGAGD